MRASRLLLAALCLPLLCRGVTPAHPDGLWNYIDTSGTAIPFRFGIDTNRAYNLTFPSTVSGPQQAEVLALTQFNNSGYSGVQPIVTTGPLFPPGSLGVVTSFSSGNLPPLFTTSVATPTSTPALSFALTNAANNTLFGNDTGAPAGGAYDTVTHYFDSAFGSAQGDLLYRNATTWVVLTPGTAGQYLQTAGAGANPAWANAATKTGLTSWVDSVNGNDGTAVRGQFGLPYLTLGAAKTGASAGDTIEVLPGTYTPSANLAKNGVNWYFYPGTTVTASGAWQGGIFDDSTYGANTACTFIIGGEGVFNYNPTSIQAVTDGAFDSAGVVSITNPSSKIWFRGSQANNNSTTGNGSSFFSDNGVFFCDCDDLLIGANGGYGIWWDNGDNYFRIKKLETGSSATSYCVQTSCTTAPTGKLWITADTITTQGYGIITADTNATAAIWINVHELNSSSATAAGSVVLHQGISKLYVTAQKIIETSTTLPVVYSSAGSGNLWLTAQKLSSSGGPWIKMDNGGAGSGQNVWAAVQNYEVVASVTTGISVAQGNLVLAGNTAAVVATTGLLISGGTANINGITFDSSAVAGGFPVNESGAGAITLNMGNVYLLSNGASDSIHATAAHTVTKTGTIFTNNAKNVNITVTSPTSL